LKLLSEVLIPPEITVATALIASTQEPHRRNIQNGSPFTSDNEPDDKAQGANGSESGGQAHRHRGAKVVISV
jgi:hypothetical protein